MLYRLARNNQGLVTNHPWDWYLTHAYETSIAMTKFADGLAVFGQMEGSIFVQILSDLKREGLTAQAENLEAKMRARATRNEHLESRAAVSHTRSTTEERPRTNSPDGRSSSTVVAGRGMAASFFTSFISACICGEPECPILAATLPLAGCILNPSIPQRRRTS